MFVLRSTMDAAIEAEQEKTRQERCAFYQRYGDGLERVTALHQQLQAWITGKTDDGVTPEQAAQMFWAQDDRWQAAFFNALEGAATASFAARDPREGGLGYIGVPAGEPQWCWMSYHLTDSGFATIEAMFEHAKSRREQVAA